MAPWGGKGERFHAFHVSLVASTSEETVRPLLFSSQPPRLRLWFFFSPYKIHSDVRKSFMCSVLNYHRYLNLIKLAIAIWDTSLCVIELFSDYEDLKITKSWDGGHGSAGKASVAERATGTPRLENKRVFLCRFVPTGLRLGYCFRNPSFPQQQFCLMAMPETLREFHNSAGGISTSKVCVCVYVCHLGRSHRESDRSVFSAADPRRGHWDK